MKLKIIIGFVLLMFGLDASGSIKIQGHRGSRGTHRENTLPAFEEAIEAHAAGIELDLQVTKDGVVVIYHEFAAEPELLTHSDGTHLKDPKLIREYSLEELKELDYGFSTHHHFPKQKGGPGSKIPTLEELFVMLRDSENPHAASLLVNLELKRDPKHPEWSIDPELFVEKIFSIVKAFGFENRVYYSSFDPLLLEKIGSKDSEARLGYLIEPEDFEFLFSNNSLIEQAHELRAKIISPHYTVLNVEIVRTLQNEGFQVVPWTVNDPIIWKNLIDMGINEVITDYPMKFVEFSFNSQE